MKSLGSGGVPWQTALGASRIADRGAAKDALECAETDFQRVRTERDAAEDQYLMLSESVVGATALGGLELASCTARRRDEALRIFALLAARLEEEAGLRGYRP